MRNLIRSAVVTTAAVLIQWTVLVAVAAAQPGPGKGATPFPAVGHTYRVAFVSGDGAQKFTVEIEFASETDMTYYNLDANGVRVHSEKVTTEVTAVAPSVFMVTWVESDKTTVVHVEDYGNLVFYTNFTDGGDTHKLFKFKGAVTLVR
jgi:hypothetical protein